MTENADSLPVDKDGRNPTEALLTGPATAALQALVERTMRNEVRICMDVSWWERLIERTGKAERWECRDREGRWRRYWRRHGSLPRWANP